MQEIDPQELGEALKQVVGASQRIVVAGGDGTIASAAAAVCGTPVELAIMPGGTLNHFARDHGFQWISPTPRELRAMGRSSRPMSPTPMIGCS